MIERLHRQVKAAIKCHQTDAWTEVLPTVMMGIRAAYKEDLNTTSAELVFGEPIRLPGQFLQDQQRNKIDQGDNFAERLRNIMSRIRPQLKRHGQPTTFIFKDLASTPKVFLRHDAPAGALQPPYDGPYEVLNRADKTYKLRINGKTVNVSIDRVKPAYTLQDEIQPTQATKQRKETQPPVKTKETRTRTERTSRTSVRFNA